MTNYGRRRIPGPVDAAAISVESGPPDVGWHAAWWAGDLSLSDGAEVASWSDITGNGREMTQSDATRRPLFRASVADMSGAPGVEFDGSNDYLRTATWTGLAQPFTYVLVFRVRSTQTAQIVYMDSASAGTEAPFFKPSNSTGWAVYAGSTWPLVSTPVYAVGNFAARVKFNNSSTVLNINGTNSTPANPVGTNSLVGTTVGAHRDDSSAAAITVGFAGVFAGDVTTDPEWSNFVAWVSASYGMTLA